MEQWSVGSEKNPKPIAPPLQYSNFSGSRAIGVTRPMMGLVLAIRFLIPLRSAKELNKELSLQLENTLDQLEATLCNETTIPKKIVGDLWFLFTSILTEAKYAKDGGDKIELVAWTIEEKLERIFGSNQNK